MKLGEWLGHAKQVLTHAGITAPALEAQLLAAKALGKERAEVLAHPEWHVREDLNDLLRRRLRLEPLDYIIGAREFYGRSFKVTPDVLIPRQDTETVIAAWKELDSLIPADARVLDLGTGSGIIGITLKLERPRLKVILSDISESAARVAKENARGHAADVEVVISDGLRLWADGDSWEDRFDAIVSNPPYIGRSEHLPEEIWRFEPPTALFAGETGLEFYERLAAEAKGFLSPSGLIILEVGYRQSQRVREIFQGEEYAFIGAYKDLGEVERVLAFSIRRLSN